MPSRICHGFHAKFFMKWIVTLTLMTVIYVHFWLLQMDANTKNVIHAKLKNSLDLAVHDAALHIDRNEKEKGYIVFTVDQARQALQTSLQTNLSLDNNLEPYGNSLLKDRVRLVWFDAVETGPFPQTYTQPAYNYVDTLYGPSIIAIIQVKHPKHFGIAMDIEYTIGASHEYKP